jgi:predicted permease
VAQVALSITLLVGAILFIRTFQNLVGLDMGMERSTVLNARFDPRLAGFTDTQLPALFERLTAAARRVPGARSVSIATTGAVTGWHRISGIVIDGEQPRMGSDGAVREDFVDDAYFSTLGFTLLRGRGFTDRDRAGAPKVAVVNEAMARKFFGGADPIGKRFGYGTPADVEIVGLLRDARIDGLKEAAPAMVFYPLKQGDEYAGNLYVRVADDAREARAALQRAIADAEPNLALREVATIAELADRTVSRERLLSQLTAAFGVLAMFVASLGLYGSLSYSVVRRTRELGVRLALGALPSEVRGLVLRETFLLVGLGVVAGAGVAAVVMQSVASLLYGLSPRDPATFLTATTMVVVIGAIAGAVPAWRASRVNPLVALRAD